MKDNEIKRINQYETAILTLIDEQDQFTRSDLQGIVNALVMKIIKENK